MYEGDLLPEKIPQVSWGLAAPKTFLVQRVRRVSEPRRFWRCAGIPNNSPDPVFLDEVVDFFGPTVNGYFLSGLIGKAPERTGVLDLGS